MERKPTRPIPPGNIKRYLRETKMSEKIKKCIPPFEARINRTSCAKETKNTTAKVAKSGYHKDDTYAGNIKKYLRETKMPGKIKKFIPPFEARINRTSCAKVTKITTAKVAKSGYHEADTYAGTFWASQHIEPLHSVSSPPPLAPLSNSYSGEKQKTMENAIELPTSLSMTKPEILPKEGLDLSWAEEVKQAEDDFNNDVLELTYPSEELEIPLREITKPEEDLFEGIVVKDPGVRRKMWYVFPPGRPKVQVIVKNRKATLRCLGRVKEFFLTEQN